MNNTNLEPTSGFPTTQWTQIIAVLQGGDDKAALAALDEFCRCYRPAIYNFFRRNGCSSEQAEDYAHDFFASRILQAWEDRAGFLLAAQRTKGKFRSFLCHVLWQFLKDQWKAKGAARAGGAVRHIPLEELAPSDERADSEAFKRFGSKFDREFALQIIQRAAERSKHSRYLLAHLKGEISQQEAARHLGMSENSFKQAYRRFRLRLAQDLWDEVAKLAGPDEQEIRGEIRYLMSLFGDESA